MVSAAAVCGCSEKKPVYTEADVAAAGERVEALMIGFAVKGDVGDVDRLLDALRVAVAGTYVRKILGIGNKYGSYGLDHSGERESSLDDPYSGYAEGDTPDGQSLFFYRLPWTQSFKFVARCVKGQMNGQVLSTIEKKFKTTGHWFGQPYTGSFVE